MNRIQQGLVASVIGLGLGAAALADDLPYKLGPVQVITRIQIKPGKQFEYWAQLSTQWRKVEEEMKREGLLLSYAVYRGDNHTPQEADTYIVETYANWAVFDHLDEKMEGVMKKALGDSLKNVVQGQAERESLRTVLGTETVQQVLFKD
jgi:quinol monooxygenase YgiN